MPGLGKLRCTYTILLLAMLGLMQPAAAAELLFVTLESPPAEFSVRGVVKGRNVEVIREACSRLNHDCQVLIVPWKRALQMTEVGTADGIIDAAYTKDRARFLDYCQEEIYVEEWYGFKLATSPLRLEKGLTNAANIRLGTSRGFVYGGEIQKALDERRFGSVEEVVDNEGNIKKLLAGRFDMFVGVRLTILYLAKQMGVAEQLSLVPGSGSGEPYLLNSSKTYLAFSRKKATEGLAQQFSSTFRQMKDDGFFTELDDRYLGGN